MTEELPMHFPRPGLLGIMIRVIAGAGLTYLGVQAILETPSYFDGINDPVAVILPILGLAYFTRPVVNELLLRSGGWRPSLVGLGVLGIAMIVGAVQGWVFGPAFGATLWVWQVGFMFLLGPAFLLAAITRTPGCEMRSFATVWAKIRGKEAKQVTCPAFIDRADRIRLFGKW